MSSSPSHEPEVAEQQFEHLLELLEGWDGTIEGSSLFLATEEKFGPIDEGSVIVAALIQSFRFADGYISRANAVGHAWFVQCDRLEADRLMSELFEIRAHMQGEGPA